MNPKKLSVLFFTIIRSFLSLTCIPLLLLYLNVNQYIIITCFMVFELIFIVSVSQNIDIYNNTHEDEYMSLL